MIRKTDCLLTEYGRFARSVSFLTEDETVLAKQIYVAEFCFEGLPESVSDGFLSDTLSSVLAGFNVYLVFSESLPQKKSKIRSLKKMFYTEKERIGQKNVYECETDLSDGFSILASVIKIDARNIEYCLSELINPNFLFGFAVLKGKRPFRSNRATFLGDAMPGKKTGKPNTAKALIHHLNDSKFFFGAASTGNDAILLQFFTKKEALLPAFVLPVLQ